MASGTLWLVSDQTTTAVVYVAWLESLVPDGVAVRHLPIDRHGPSSMPSKLGRLTLQGFRAEDDRVLIVQDWEDDWESNDEKPPRAPMRLAVQAARNVFETRYGLAELDRIRAFLIPPTTEGWYLLLAEVDPAIRGILTSVCNATKLQAMISRRLSHARDPHSTPPPPKDDVNSLLQVRHDLPKRQLAERIAAQLAQPKATATPSSAPCLTSIADWLASWP